MNLVNVSMEAIGFQSPDLAKEVYLLVDDIMSQHNPKDADNCKEHKKLTKLLKDTTGMNIKLVFDTDIPPGTAAFHINPDSILGDKDMKGYYLEKTKDTMKRLLEVKSKSFIDLKKAKVGGIFSEIEIPIYMGYRYLRAMRWSSWEVTAVLAHEIGHGFGAYEMAFRTVRTNQILAAAAKAAGGGDQGEYEYVLKSSEKLLDLKSGVFDELLTIKDQKTVMTVILGEAEQKAKEESLMGNAVYDITNFEAMADQFAARLGLGKHLVTALEKMHREFGSEFNPGLRIAMTLSDITKVAGLIGGAFILSAAPFLVGFYYALIGLIVYAQLDGREHNNVYDKLSIRFKRIKEQMIQYLKDTKLPRSEVEKTLDSIAHTEKIISSISEYNGLLVGIFNMIDPASRKIAKAREIQQNLETIVANDMYLKAAQLRNL